MTNSKPKRISRLEGRNSETYVAAIPGSKSYTNRALVIAAMRMGTTHVTNGLICDDTVRLAKALDSFVGLSVTQTDDGFRVERSQERIGAPAEPCDMGGAGTPARFMLAFAASAEGETVVTGNARLCERPMGDILDAMRNMGLTVDCEGTDGCLPARVHGGAPTTNEWKIRGDVSSQFTSSLILYASQQAEGPISIHVEGTIVSRPYVEMTLSMMSKCGLRAERTSDRDFVVHPGAPQSDTVAVEVDASGMSYYLAAAAITQTTVEIRGIGGDSAQGDVGLARAFESMGCELTVGDDFLRLTGKPLRGIEIDMDTMPDVVMSLAMAAAVAEGTTKVVNIANLRVKECDRIHATAAELTKLGGNVEEGEDFLVIHPQPLSGASIHCYDDHRVAMAFGTLGLVVDGVEIEDPDCVVKSFPNFWDEMARFRAHHGEA